MAAWADACLCASTDFLLPALTGSDLVMQSYRKKFRASNWFWHFSKKDAFWLIWTDKHLKENLAIVSIDYNNIVLTEIIGNTAKLGGAKNRERKVVNS